jgi:biotin/methionine sulfoxide reductase
MTVEDKTGRLNASHWGLFVAEQSADGDLSINAHPDDPDPSLLISGMADAIKHPTRIAAPMIRKGWLDKPSTPARRDGSEEFVQVSWDTAISLTSAKMEEVIKSQGNEGIFGGSYGWGSAGRFHHAQSQIHRFLNCLGGYTASVNSYSVGTAQVLLPRVMAGVGEILRKATSWPVIARETEVFLLFGGIAEKNLSVAAGGVSRHQVRSYLKTAAERGAEFHLVSPQRSDLSTDIDACWYDIIPGTDTALMLGMAFSLIEKDNVDEAFVNTYCTGYERLRDYILGTVDGIEKNPNWASEKTGIDAEQIESLAELVANKRSLINVSWSLQRAPYGEQPLWMGIALASMLGQIGLAGGGFAHAYGASDEIGRPLTNLPLPTLSLGDNGVADYIPVARLSDMLLNPGGEYDYDGERRRYPDISLMYWAGGNPFHHQQDLFKLERALSKVETIIVHEPYWTAMARRSDIVLPTTVTVERNDIFAARNDPRLVAMKQACDAFGEARNDYDIFSALADKLGIKQEFTENRSEMEWLQHLYEDWRTSSNQNNDIPGFEDFWESNELEYQPKRIEHVLLSEFRNDPVKNSLPTPGGLIELYSETIAGFNYDDCPGHPTWFEPKQMMESLVERKPQFILIANNPATRLHSQLDNGAVSQQSKIRGREPLRMHSKDAHELGLSTGDIIIVSNKIGACLAGLKLDDSVRQGVVQLATGAWFDPQEIPGYGRICVHGNPNVLIPDKGTSKLSQGTSGQHSMVNIKRWDGALPDKTIDTPPTIVAFE